MQPITPGETPRLTDQAFFANHVDTARPGLAGVAVAVEQGDYDEARRLFAADVRRSLQPERFFRIERTYRHFNFLRAGETEAAAAQRILDGTFIAVGVPYHATREIDFFANPTHNQYAEWTWQFNRHPEWAVLAERYRKTGDERYAGAIVRFFRRWVQQTAGEPFDAPPSATRAWRSLDAGDRMNGSWPWALHAIVHSPQFDDDVLVAWYKSVWEHGWRLRHHHYTQNWLIVEMNGLAHIGILHPQLREAAAWTRYAFDTLVRQFSAQVYPDGWQYELCTHTHQNMIRHTQRVWDLARAYAVPAPAAFGPSLERMHAVNLKLMMPDGRLPDLNDGNWHEVAGLLAQAVADFPHRQDFRWAQSGGAEGEPPAETSLAFPYAGYYVMRNGWEANAIWALFDGGPFGYTHQHEDKLNLLVHAYGRLLLTEGGNYAFDDSEMRRYVISTRAHNSVRVDGMDQNRRLHFRKAEVDLAAPASAQWTSSAGFDGVEAAYDEGYGPAADRTVVHRRKVLFLKHGITAADRSLNAQLAADLSLLNRFRHLPPAWMALPCFLVIDWLLPGDEVAHRYEVLWHLNTGEPVVAGLTVRSIDEGQANLAVVAAAVPGLSVDVVSGQTDPEWQGWRSVKARQQGEYAPLPTAIYRLRAVGPVRLATLLVPLAN